MDARIWIWVIKNTRFKWNLARYNLYNIYERMLYWTSVRCTQDPRYSKIERLFTSGSRFELRISNNRGPRSQASSSTLKAEKQTGSIRRIAAIIRTMLSLIAGYDDNPAVLPLSLEFLGTLKVSKHYMSRHIVTVSARLLALLGSDP